MICRARSGVAPITAITTSTLSVSRNGMRLMPVICCSSSSTPSSLATMPARSTSRPTGCWFWSVKPNGGTSIGTPIRTTP